MTGQGASHCLHFEPLTRGWSSDDTKGQLAHWISPTSSQDERCSPLPLGPSGWARRHSPRRLPAAGESIDKRGCIRLGALGSGLTEGGCGWQGAPWWRATALPLGPVLCGDSDSRSHSEQAGRYWSTQGKTQPVPIEPCCRAATPADWESLVPDSRGIGSLGARAHGGSRWARTHGLPWGWSWPSHENQLRGLGGQGDCGQWRPYHARAFKPREQDPVRAHGGGGRNLAHWGCATRMVAALRAPWEGTRRGWSLWCARRGHMAGAAAPRPARTTGGARTKHATAHAATGAGTPQQHAHKLNGKPCPRRGVRRRSSALGTSSTEVRKAREVVHGHYTPPARTRHAGAAHTTKRGRTAPQHAATRGMHCQH